MRKDTSRTFLIAGVIIAFVFVISGCGPFVPAPKRYSEFNSGLQVDLPQKWLQFTKAKNGFTITRDGLRLEKITIKTTKVGKKIEGIERVYLPNMLPHEVADLSIGLIKAQPDVKSFEVHKVNAIQLAGQDGYRVDAVYIDEGGLVKRIRMDGAIVGKYVYELIYEAVDQVYFQKYESIYQNIVSSVKIKS